MVWFDLLAVQGTLKSLLQHHSSKASVLQCSAITPYRWILLFSFCRWEYMVRPYNSAEGTSWVEPWQSDSQPNFSTTALYNLTHPVRNPDSSSSAPYPEAWWIHKGSPCVSHCHLFLGFPASAEFFFSSIFLLTFFLIFHLIFVSVIHPYSLESQIQTFKTIYLFASQSLSSS